MGQLLVRGIEDAVIARLRERAAAHGRSVEAEHRDILRAVLDDPEERRREREALIARLRRLQAETDNRGGPPAAELVREDRDGR